MCFKFDENYQPTDPGKRKCPFAYKWGFGESGAWAGWNNEFLLHILVHNFYDQ